MLKNQFEIDKAVKIGLVAKMLLKIIFLFGFICISVQGQPPEPPKNLCILPDGSAGKKNWQNRDETEHWDSKK